MKLAYKTLSKLTLLVSFLIINSVVQAQLATYNFDGDPGSGVANSSGANITANDFRASSALSIEDVNGRFSYNNWPNSASVDLTRYYEFSIAADVGYTFSLTNLQFKEEREHAETPTEWQVRSSLDGYGSVIASGSTTDGSLTTHDVDLTGGTYDNIATPISFRIYAYNFGSSHNSNRRWEVDDVILSGSTTAPTATNLITIDFESVNYTLSTPTSPGMTSFWGVFVVADHGTTHSINTGPPTGVQGNNYLAYRDGNTVGTNDMVNTTSIDVTNFDNIDLNFALANVSIGDGFETDDILTIEYQYDGGGYQFLTQWAGDGGGGYMTEDADGTGGGDGVASTELGPLFKNFVRTVPKEGTMLDIRITVITSVEDTEIDNIAIFGTTDVTNPVASAPTNTPQTLSGGTTSTSTVESTEFGNIYLVLNGEAASNQTEIDAAIAANNAFLGQASALANSAYTVTPLGTLNDGVYDIVAVDAAGNISAIVAGWLTVDNTDPAIPTALNLDAADDTGTSNSDDITQTTSGLTIDGVGENGSTITLTSDIDGALVGSDVVSGGTWSFDITLSDNTTHSITAIATDDAGNTSTASAPLVIQTDNIALAPGSLDLDGTDDTGSSNSDNITQTIAGLTIDGTGENGATVTLTSNIDGALAGSTTVAGGVWSHDINLTDDTAHDITAVQTDLAGNVSVASSILLITTDNTAPAVPSALDLDASDDSGILNNDDITQNTSGLTIDGNGENGSVVALSSSIDGSLAGSATVAGGMWTLDISLTANSTHDVTATATDVAGNSSAASSALSITVDTTVPTTPAALNLDNTDDTGASNTDNITQTTAGLTIDGTGENGSTINLTSDVDGSLVGSDVVSGGTWSFDITLSDNTTHGVTAIATDAAGNTSTASAPIIIQTDNSVAAPGGLDLDNADDTGTSNTDNITQTLSGLTIDGTGENGASVTLTSSIDGVLAGSATVAGGTWSHDISLTDNSSHNITAVQTDLAGNVSVASSILNIVTDNVAPASPAGLDLDNADDSGSSNIDNITMNTSGLTFSGTGVNGTIINLNSNVDGAIAGSTTVAGGVWSLDVSLSANASHTITATATDEAGNVSIASAPINITVDTTNPSIPTALNLNNLDDTGISDTDNITQTTTGLSIDGSGENGSVITLSSSIDGALAGSATVAGGVWGFDITLTDNNTHNVTAVATDVAGNMSSASVALVIQTDNLISPPTSLDLDNSDDTGSSNTDNITQTITGLTINGAGENGATVTVSSNIDGVLAGNTTVAGGTWSHDISLSDNTTHSITATQVDLAGNTSTVSTAIIITTDNINPATPTALDLNNADDTGLSATDNITQNISGLSISGNGENGSVITLTSNIDGALAGSNTVAGGTWGFDIALTDNNTHNITAIATDVAGNTSPASAVIVITTDNISPTTPAALDLNSVDDTGISNTDNITQVVSGLSMSGSGENGSVVTLTSDIDGALAGSATAAGGTWGLDIGLSDNTVHNITASATDLAGNTSGTSASLQITTDNLAPIVSPNEFSLDNVTTITFTISEELSLSEGQSASGFATNNGLLQSSVYSGKGSSNTITLNANVLFPWNSATTVSYTPGNVADVAGNTMAAFPATLVTQNIINLSAGDIAFTGYLGDNDEFSFVLLKDVETGTRIKFTDNGWTDDDVFTSGEQTVIWTAPSRVFAGTEIVISTGLTASLGTLEGSDLDFSTDGDQVLAYQGNTTTTTTFLAALHMNGSWDSFTSTSNDNKSNVPLGLTDQTNAIDIDSENDNATYDYAAEGTTGNVATLLNLINGSDSRWGKNNDPGNSAITFPTGGDNYTMPPDVSALSPAHSSTVSVSTAGTITATYDENIQKSIPTGSNIILRRSDNTLVDFWDLNAPEVTVSGTDLIIDASAVPYQDAVTYRVYVEQWSIEDVVDGNHNTRINLGDWEFTIDDLNPFVTDIVLDPTVTTNGSTTDGVILGNDVRYIVTFNEDVTGVDPTDFAANSTSGSFSGTIGVSQNTPSEYVVTISNIDNDPNDLGELRLNFINNSIADLVGNNGAGTFNGSTFFTIIKDEPTNHPTNFAAVDGADNFKLNLSWDAPVSGIIPDGYLVEVIGPTGAFAAAPTDLVAVTDDLDFSDDYGVFNVSTVSAVVDNLNSATSYDFRIYPYTNDPINIDYKVDGTPVEVTASTSSAARTTLSFQGSDPSLPATHNNVGSPTVWSLIFGVWDDDPGVAGNDDDTPTRYNQLTVTLGTGNEIPDLTELLDGALLSDGGSNTSNATTITANQIIFSGLPNAVSGNLGRVDDNNQRLFGIRLFIKTDLSTSVTPADLHNIVDGLNVVIDINGSDIITEAAGSSGFAPGTTVTSGSTNNEIEVTADKFLVVQNPAPIEGQNVPFNSDPIFEVRGVNNNLDLDYAGTYDISAPEANTNLSGISDTFNGDGQLNAGQLRYTSAGDGTLTITGPSMIPATTTPVDVIKTLFRAQSTGVRPAGNLPSPGVNQIIYGFTLNAISSTTNQPAFEQVRLNFTKDITNVFENFRLFKVTNLVPNPTLGADAVIVPGSAINTGLSTTTSVVFDSFSEILDPDTLNVEHYYLVADVSKNTFSGSVRVTASSNDIVVTSGSTHGAADPGPNYTFIDVEAPLFTLNPTPGAINVNSAIMPQITFDEPVILLDTTFVVKLYSDNSDVATVTSATANADSTVFTFDPGLLLDDTQYYILFAPGNTTNQTGFVDRSGKAAQGITTKDGWSFTTADAVAPNFTELNPANLFINEYDEGFDIRAQLNELGTVYYILTDGTEGSPPTTAEIFDPGTYTDVAKLESGTIDIEASNSYFYKSIIGLNSGSNYKVYMVAEDDVPNRQSGITQPDGNAIPLVIDVTTDGSSPAQIFSSSIDMCVGEFQTIDQPIHILESSSEDDIRTDGSFSFELALPPGFIFNQSAGNVSHLPSGDITSSSLTFRNATVAKINYSATGNSGRDKLTISDLEIKADLTAISGTMELIGNATNGAFSYGDAAVNITLSSIPPVNFTFDPQQALYRLEDFPVNNPVRLIVDPTFEEANNVFSGPQGIVGDLLVVPFAGVGTHDITLLHTDDNGCQATTVKSIEIIDESIFGLESSYCDLDATDIILADDPDPDNPRSSFTLVSLEIDTVGIASPGNPNSLTPNGLNWDFVAENSFISDTSNFVEMNFIGIYERKSNPAQKDTITQRVTVYALPEVSLQVSNQQHEDPSLINNFCDDFNSIEIEGSPAPINGISTGFFEVEYNSELLDDSLFVDNGDGLLTMIPSELAELGFGTYTVTYNYTNDTTFCSSVASLDIEINQKPTVAIAQITGCEGQEVILENTSTAVINRRRWDFDDEGKVKETLNPSDNFAANVYSNPGSYNITLEVESDKGCLGDNFASPYILNIGGIPQAEFNYTGVDIEDEFSFTNTTGKPGILSFDTVTTLTWHFGDGNQQSINRDTNVSDIINYNYNMTLIDTVSLIVESSIGCVDTIAKPIAVLDKYNVTNAPSNGFETGSEGWTIIDPNNNSWMRSSQNDNIGQNGNFMWVTGVNSSYNGNEVSYVYSPTMDISAVARPLIQFDAFWDMATGDGAILQYSLDNKNVADPTKLWSPLGEIESGEDWYNGDNLPSRPGKGTTDYGWSDSLGMQQPKHVLDSIPIASRQNVNFRFAFSSINSSPNNAGFAFDNLFFGTRTRTVMVENFTNTSQSGVTKAESDYLKGFDVEDADGTVMIKINYHTDFPGFDPLNDANTVDPSARALYYDISQTPRAVIDGFISEDAPFSDWGLQRFNLRSLILAQFDLDLDVSNSNGAINIEAIPTPQNNSVLNENILITAAVLEKDVALSQLGISSVASTETDFEFVLRKLLPNAAGFRLNTSGAQNQVPMDPVNFSWIPGNVIDLDDLAVVVFVQNEMTKEIYQSEIILDVTAPDQVTSIEAESIENFNLYPNPANEQVTIVLGSHQSDNIEMYDSFGKLIYSKSIDQNDRQIDVDTRDLAAGLYHVQLRGKDNLPVRKRLVIMHRE